MPGPREWRERWAWIGNSNVLALVMPPRANMLSRCPWLA